MLLLGNIEPAFERVKFHWTEKQDAKCTPTLQYTVRALQKSRELLCCISKYVHVYATQSTTLYWEHECFSHQTKYKMQVVYHVLWDMIQSKHSQSSFILIIQVQIRHDNIETFSQCKRTLPDLTIALWNCWARWLPCHQQWNCHHQDKCIVHTTTQDSIAVDSASFIGANQTRSKRRPVDGSLDKGIPDSHSRH